VVILTASATDEEIATAFELGVSGLVLKDSPPDTVVEAIRSVALGRSWFDREVLGRALMSRRRERERPAPQSTLTAREIELIRLVGDGLRNRDIAARLSISEGTVKIHLHNIYDKLGVDGRLELVLAAQHKGLI
jgi:DNA-binding NarL/FixJ family response regulator